MKLPRLTIESILYILVFVLALSLRFYNLGETPLSDDEAGWAFQAWQISNSSPEIQETGIGPQPAYLCLTSFLFDLFGANNFLARFWPALSGALLIFLPIFFRRELRGIVALIAMTGLALDPGLVTVSRQAGGPMMAFAFGSIGVGFWHIRKQDPGMQVLAGIAGGLALLSGPAVLIGLTGICLAWFVNRRIIKARSENEEANQSTLSESDPNPKITSTWAVEARMAVLSTGLTILLVGTCFFTHPQGLAAWLQMLPAYLSGWITSPDVSIGQIIAALLVYQPLAVLLTLLGVIRWLIRQGLGEELEPFSLSFLYLWVIASLLMNLLYPGRKTNDLVWTLVPLWITAADAMKIYIPKGKSNLISLLQAGLILVLAALFWNTLIATSQIVTSITLETTGLRFGILIGIISLGGLTTVLVSWGWSWETSRNGLMWGVLLALSIYLISAMWGASQLRTNQPQELWSHPPAIGQADLFMATMQDLSRWKTGLANQIDAVSIVDAPSLRWILRDYPNIHFNTGFPLGTLPSIIITRQDQEAPALTTSYRGQDFSWWIWPGWNNALPENPLEWFTFRKAPLYNEKLILWAQSDLFSGGTSDSNPNTNETQE
jgi:predicted membrane-bound mannosyltransferase